MTSAAVSDYLERYYFPTFGVPKSMVSDKAKTFCCRQFKDYASSGGRPYHDHSSLPPGFVGGESKQEFESRIEDFAPLVPGHVGSVFAVVGSRLQYTGAREHALYSRRFAFGPGVEVPPGRSLGSVPGG